MIAAPLIGMPLFLAVQLLRADPVVLGVFMVGATFVAFLGMAWGKRGAPVAIGVMLAVICALSTPPPADARSPWRARCTARWAVSSTCSGRCCPTWR